MENVNNRHVHLECDPKKGNQERFKRLLKLSTVFVVIFMVHQFSKMKENGVFIMIFCNAKLKLEKIGTYLSRNFSV